jgi:hypothetical protein
MVATASALVASTVKEGRNACALHEERHRRCQEHGGRVERPADLGQGQRRHHDLVLPAHPQPHPAGHQRLQSCARAEQVRHQGCCRGQLLEVVQQEQQLSVSQVGRQLPEQGLPAALVQAKRLGDGGQEQTGLAEGCQADRDRAVGEGAGEGCSDLLGQAGLAHPTRTGQGHQPHLGPLQERLHRHCLVFAPH